MPANERFVGRARRSALETVARLGHDIQDARIALGLSQAAMARGAGLSRSVAGRLERGEDINATVADLLVLGAVVGLEVSVRAYPVGPPLRDRAHAALLERFRRNLPTGLKWATEVPLPNPGDLRAWDAMVSGAAFRVGIEAETRARDGQSLERRIRAKQRDGGVDAVILVLADTRSNRAFMRERAASFDELFPVRATAALSDLRAGRCPVGNAVILV
ncbi:MAG: helix-turn-helix transcriptional regulator [Chloroflexota bacterium]